ncbi:MAG TPA: DUF1549 and DUF1553 domain-containing protein [Gemmataceae bacterium]|nr:DUF1549 and DUF1553 domain-containing protein [Gemmataceae bacterium]
MICSRPLLFLTLLSTAGMARAQDVLEPRRLDHWAWKAPVQPALPEVKRTEWVRSPVDRFILAKMEAAALQPTAPAGREQLLRRASIDLIGLPPTPAEIDAFVNDKAPDAWERVVDRLQASPHYGERWGRHWLDLARYAESNGYEFDELRPNAWRYRDYVIRSWNADKPYDRFIREQIAGDETADDDADARIATAFNLLGPDMTDAADQVQRRHNTLNDMTDAFGLVFLGMTIGCARCHDHKFEAIPQTDYYRLQAFFESAQFRRDVTIAPRPEREAYARALAAYEERTKPIRADIARLETPHRQQLSQSKLAKLSEEAQAAQRTPTAQRTAAQKEIVAATNRLIEVSQAEVDKALSPEERRLRQAFLDQLKTLESLKPRPLPSTMALEDGTPAKTYLLVRGDLSNRGEEVRSGYPVALTSNERAGASAGSRTDLAAWLTRPGNPLTARVLVNRLWQHHFGRGLVATSNDFGIRGQAPTHPELLDWLACEFVARGWSIKQMHRLLLTSSVYQQGTVATVATREQDPDNRLWTRMQRNRVEGEVVRDALLAAAGLLDCRLGGPSVLPEAPVGAFQGSQGWKPSPDPRDQHRRSVYILARRNLHFPFLEAFDAPDSNQSCPIRERSTTAPQALALLNAEITAEAARALAVRLEHETSDPAERVRQGYRMVLGRWPSAGELRRAERFLQDSPAAELYRALFNLNEFLYRD